MSRAKQFDPERALDAAMTLFWERGYEVTSVQDLVERLGINRFSLYSTFGDKHQLFLAALDRYRDRVVTPAVVRLEQPGAALPEVRAYFAFLVAHADGLGCLMANSLGECARHDPAVAQRTAAHVERLRTAFHRALTAAQARGEVRAALDAGAVARQLAVSVQGLALYSKLRPGRRALDEYVAGLLAPLT